MVPAGLWGLGFRMCSPSVEGLGFRICALRLGFKGFGPLLIRMPSCRAFDESLVKSGTLA